MIQFNDKILEQLDPNEYWVLSHLLKRCDNNRTCFPSTETLMSDCKMGKNTIQSSINSLVKKGFVTKKQQVFKGKLSSNIYEIVSTLVGKYSKPLVNLPLTENQPTVNLPLTEIPLTEKGATKVLITSLESINHSFETTTTKKGENFEKNNFENVIEVESEKEEKSCAKKENRNWAASLAFQIFCIGKVPHLASLGETEIRAIFGAFQRENENNAAFENKSEDFFNDRFAAFCVNQKKNSQYAKSQAAQEEKPLMSVLDCIEKVKEYFNQDQTMKEICVMTAKFYEGTDGSFDEEISNFCIYNANRFEFLRNPIKGMPHIFTKWLTHAKVFNKPKPNYSTTKNTQNEQSSNRNQRNGHTYDREQSNLILDRFKELVRSGQEAFPVA